MTDSSHGAGHPFADDDPLLHQFKNHLSVIVGFSELLLRDLPDDDPRHGDVLEINRTAHAALALLPGLTPRRP